MKTPSTEDVESQFAALTAKFDEAMERGDVAAMRAVMKSDGFAKTLLAHSITEARAMGTPFQEGALGQLGGVVLALMKKMNWSFAAQKARADAMERRLSEMEQRLAETSAMRGADARSER